jgi:uncharacterized membrane protein YozB (DUF420 family)
VAAYFYSVMSLVIAGVVAYGFSRTIDAGLIHPAYPPPLVLYLHAAIFGGWIVLLMIQSALIRSGNMSLHRKVGLAGIALGSAIPAVGMATAIAMARVHTQQGSTDEAAFLVVSFYDMAAFAIAFGLAIAWRRQPEFHRRLMLIASCTLTVAAFNRFPAFLVPPNWGFAGVDALILLGVGRDLIIMGRIHPAYLYGLPAIVAGQALTMYTYLNSLPLWTKIAQRLVG